MQRFRGKVVKEGSKNSSIRVTVPKKIVALLQLPAPCWARARINGSEPFFTWARRPPSRNTVEIGLPQRLFPAGLARTVVDVAIEAAAPYRAPAWTDVAGFDWLPHVVHEHYLPTETVDGELVVYSRHEEAFKLRRVTPLPETYRMLGVYQAEGSKGRTAIDFSYANSNPLLLAHTIELLAAWGIDRDRLALTVLHEPGKDPAVARAVYAPLGLPTAAERDRTGAGAHAALIQIRSSMTMLRLVRSALDKVFTSPFPSAEAARAFALGWLDGDGSIIHGRTSDELRLAGYETEHAVVKRALVAAFGWVLGKRGHFRNTDDGTVITLRPHEMLDLLDARAFIHSMNRVRLFRAFGNRTDEATQAGRVRYERAIARANELWRTRPELFGRKGVPYPSEMDGM